MLVPRRRYGTAISMSAHIFKQWLYTGRGLRLSVFPEIPEEADIVHVEMDHERDVVTIYFRMSLSGSLSQEELDERAVHGPFQLYHLAEGQAPPRTSVIFPWYDPLDLTDTQLDNWMNNEEIRNNVIAFVRKVSPLLPELRIRMKEAAVEEEPAEPIRRFVDEDEDDGNDDPRPPVRATRGGRSRR